MMARCKVFRYDYLNCITFNLYWLSNILLYLVQNVVDMGTVENPVTVTRNDVKTNSDCPVSTGVSIPKEANSCMIQHMLRKLQKHIKNLPILPTYWCRVLGSLLGATIWVPASQPFWYLPNCTCCTGWIRRRSRTIHWSGQELRTVLVHTIMSWMVLHYLWKTSGGIFNLLRHEQGFNQLACMVGTYKASTYVQAKVWSRDVSLRPNHPHISGAWIAPAF